jgi:ribonucleoside-diphosphate reductase beta chain
MATTYATLRRGGLRRDHAALLLWEKAKRLGTWNPSDLDLAQDRADWLALSAPERDMLMHLGALFMAGEEAVTVELLPLMRAVAADGYLEDEIYLTSFLWEEAKHVDFFQRIFTEVIGEHPDLHRYQSDAYRRLFDEELGGAMGRLLTDTSPVAQAEASVTYNMIVEGVLAETGYHAWYTILEERGMMPGTVQGVRLLQRDEARHVRYGVYLLGRLSAEHGDAVWEAIEAKLMELLPVAVGVFAESFERIEAEHGHIPFGVDPEHFADFAMNQFTKRYERLQRARSQPLETLLYPKRTPVAA